MACPQNNVMTALLLSNKATRDIILPLITDLQKTKSLVWIHPEQAALLLIKEKKLEANVYSLFMNGDKKNIYKPVLMDKFISAFTSRGQVEQAWLQKLLKQIDNNEAIGVIETLNKIKELWIWDLSIEDVTKRLQDNLISDYVYKNSYKFKLDGVRVSYREYRDYYTAKWELPPKVASDSVYKSIQKINWDESWLESLNDFLIYNAVQEWDVNSTISLIKKSVKWDFSLKEINNASREELASIIIPNLKNKELVEAAANRIKELDGMDVEDVSWNIIKQFINKPENYKPTADEIIQTMSKSLKSKLNFLNKEFWTKLDFEDFKALLNKIGWLNTEKHIENYIKKVISAKLSSEKYEWITIKDKAITSLSSFFKNYYRSFSEVPNIGMINVNTGKWENIWSADTTVFVKIDPKLKWKSKIAWDIFEEAKNAYTIPVWNIKVVDISELGSFLKTEEWSKITHVLTATKSASQTPDLVNILKDKTVAIISPSWGNSVVFKTDKKWQLIIASDDYNAIERTRQRWIQNGSYSTPEIDEWKLWESLDRWIDNTFPNKIQEDKNIAKEFIISGNEDTAAVDFERNMRMATVVDENSQYWFVNVDDIRPTIVIDDIKIYIKQEFNIDLADDIDLDDTLKELYINAKYAPRSDWQFQEIANWQIELLKYLWVKWTEDMVNVAKNSDTAMYIMKWMYTDWYGNVVRQEGIYDFINSVRNWATVSDVAENEFFKWFVKQNTSKDFDLLSVSEGIFNKMKSLIDEYKYIPEPRKQSWFWLYLIKDSSKYWEMNQSLVKVINEWKKWNIKKAVNVFKEIQDSVNKAIDEYSDEFLSEISKLKDWEQLDQAIQRRMKNKLFASLREREIAMNIFMKSNWETHVFSIPSIYDNLEVDYFKREIITLKERYQIDVNKIEDNINTKPSDVIEWKTIIADKDWALVTLTNEQIINEKIYSLPDNVNIDSIIPAWWIKSLSVEQQNNISKVLDVIKSMLFRKKWIYTTTFEAIQPWMGRFVTDYTNETVIIGWKTTVIPKILTTTNTSKVLSTEQDFDIKSRIYKKVSEIIQTWTLTGIELQTIIRKIVSEFADANNVMDSLDAMVDDYVSDFSWYLFVPKIDKDIVDAWVKIANRKFDLTIEQEQILSQITYKDWNWRNQSLLSSMDIDIKQYPDILYRKEAPLQISEVKWGQEIDKELTIRNVKLAVDELDNWFKAVDKYHQTALWSIKNSANEILETAPRLKNLKNIINLLLEWWETVYAELSPLLYSFNSLLGGTGNFLGINANKFDAKYVWELADKYKTYMWMSNTEFNNIIKWEPSWLERSAWKIASHYRMFKGLIWDLTVDRQINLALQRDIDNMFDNIVKLDWNKYVFESGEWKWEQKINAMSIAAKNWEILFGMNTLRDLWIWYKERAWTMFWFGAEFYDDWLGEFNKLFNSNVNLNQYRTIMWATTWDVLYNPMFKWMSYVKWLYNFATSPLSRLLSTIPWSFVSWVPSAAGYINTLLSLKKINGTWWNMEWLGDFRKNSWILESAAVDFLATIRTNSMDSRNPVQSFVEWAQSNPFWNKYALQTLLWQGFDNGQNVIDAGFSYALKNQATAWALKSEWIVSIEDLYTTLKNPNIAETFKRDLMGRIATKSYDLHEGMINYIGRWITRNIDTWDFMSKFSWVVSTLMTPINFRAGLGNNAILNTISNLGKVIDYSRRYWFVPWDVINAVSKDPTLRQFFLSWLNDYAMALKLANLNDYGEDVNDRKLNNDDILAALAMASQNYQFLNMSAGFRMIKDWLNWDWNKFYNIASEYTRSMFRQLRVARMSLEWARVLSTGNTENFYAYLNKMFDEMSTWAIRYMTQDVQWKSIAVDTWISTLFWWKNVYQEQMYNKSIGNAEFEQWRKWESKDDNIAWTVIKDLMMSSEVWKIFPIAWQIGTNLIWNANEKAWRTIAETLWIDYDKSYLSAWAAVTAFLGSDEYSKYVDGKYQFEKKNTYTLWDWFAEYATEVNEIIKQMKLPYVVGSSDFAEMIDAFRKTWSTAFETKNKYKVREDKSMTQVLEDMQKNGKLDDVYEQIRNTRDADETQRILSNYIVWYIDTMTDKPLNADLLQQRIRTSYLYNNEVWNWRDEQKKELKELLKVKKVTLNDADDLERNARFVDKYFNELQDTASNWRESWMWLNVATNLYAKNNPEMNKAFFDVEEGDDGTYKIKGMKPQFEKAISQRLKIESDIENWISPSTAIQWIYGPYSLFAATMWDSFEYNQQANLEWVLHLSKFIDSRNNISLSEKEYLKINVIGNIPEGAVSIQDIEKTMWIDIADGYRQSLYQSYTSWVNIANAMLDDKSSKWGNRSWIAKISLGKLTESLGNIKKYMDKNAWDMYKPMTIHTWKIIPYAIPEISKWESQLRSPQIPAYSAKSKSIIPKPKKVKSPELKPVKEKVLKTPKKRWAK